MSLLDGLRYRLRVLLRPGDVGRELDEEARFHLALEAMQQEHAARGALSTPEARIAARRRFGNLAHHTEERRRMAGLGFLDVLTQDVRFALRSFRRSPGFTAIAVATLAIGIGANTAIFSAVHAMLLRPLPFAEPDRLMKLSMTRPARGEWPANDDVTWSYPKWVVFRDAQTSFGDAALWTDWQFTVRTGDESDRLKGEVASGRYFATLGVRPALGRDFVPDEDRAPDGSKVVVISDALWRRAYDASPAALGRTLHIGSSPFTIIGVMPPGFRGLSGQAELWQPLMSFPADQLNEAYNHSYYAVARLKDGVAPERARAEVASLGAAVNERYPEPEFAGGFGTVARMLDDTRADPTVKRSLLVLLGAVGLVLLIACANVANLFLVRASSRRREIAVRLAVGAGRWRLVRQLLTESLMLASLGAMASVVVAWFGARALAQLAPAAVTGMQLMGGLGAVSFEAVRLDGAALAFTAALALFTGIVFGLLPALQATRPSLSPALKEEGEPPVRRGVARLAGRNALVIAETALALVLLAGSGLMLRSLGNLLGTHPGVDVENVLTLRFSRTDRVGRDSLNGTYEQILERVRALPGVTAAGLSNCQPLGGGCNVTGLKRRDRPSTSWGGGDPDVAVHWISPGWTEAMRVPLVRGRLFDSRERSNGPKAVLINEAAAKKIWPGEDPIGKPISVGQGGFDRDTATVVGIVGDVRYISMSEPAEASVYLPYSQSPMGRTMLFVRTGQDPVSLVPAARRVMRELAPDFPVYDIKTMEARAADSLGYARFTTLLLAIFGALALGLAALGIYGVISFTVAQRTKEIGIRMALGATRGDVVRGVIGRGALLALVGVAFGLAGAIATTGLLRGQLFGVTPNDPVTLAAMVALIFIAALVASWLPARRAATVAPTEALRGG